MQWTYCHCWKDKSYLVVFAHDFSSLIVWHRPYEVFSIDEASEVKIETDSGCDVYSCACITSHGESVDSRVENSVWDAVGSERQRLTIPVKSEARLSCLVFISTLVKRCIWRRRTMNRHDGTICITCCESCCKWYHNWFSWIIIRSAKRDWRILGHCETLGGWTSVQNF